MPSLDWLADRLGVSRRYMSDTIKTDTGKTAIDQINLYLVEEAKNLLLEPKSSISETAYKLGFEYPQYFSRLFKKKTGLSPKEYIENASMN
nr:helix-turn-helix transcriptional regulator [uncultured Marinifilum sp.]